MPPRRLVLAVLLIGMCAFGASGCATLPILAVGDVLNAAEVGKTGYDMASGLCERPRLVQDQDSGVEAQARLRAALDAQGGSLRNALPVVAQDRAFVLGTYASPDELRRARLATRHIKGVRETILCLYPAGSGRNAPVSDGEMRDDILRMADLRTPAVRVHVVEGNAVLIGRVGSRAERARIARAARRAGALSVRDYILLASADGKASLRR